MVTRPGTQLPIWSSGTGKVEGRKVMYKVPRSSDIVLNNVGSIKAVVMEVDDSGNYKLGTELGALSQMYVRSQFKPAVEKFLNISNVPNQTISLREAARGSSIGLGQGFLNAPVKQVVVANAANVSKQQKSAIVGAIAVMLVK